jgi:hypothetical protein
MINRLYVNGGSQCIGAGFIWKDVKKIYQDKGTQINNHLDFAYPSILSKKLQTDVVIDGCPGGSIKRMIRKTYDYIFNNKIDETLIILEVPPGWRDEFYSIELNRYVNMTIGNILSYEDLTEVANGYDIKDLRKIHKDITGYFYNFVDDKLELEKNMMSLLGLLSYFKLNNINYLLIDTGDFHTYLYRKSLPLDYNFVWFDNDANPMWEWINKNNLTIENETNALSNDQHMGIEGNELVADKLYQIITNEYQSYLS